MSNRLALLEEFLKDDPHDPFNKYALALEYLKLDISKARMLFDELLAQHENYVPTYYHAGQLYLTLDQADEALKIWKKGISKARSQGDIKAMRELQSVYDELTL